MKDETDENVCLSATSNLFNFSKNKKWNSFSYDHYVREAFFRGLDCGVRYKSASVYKDSIICSKATFPNKNSWNIKNLPFVTEAKKRGLDCGIVVSKKTVIASNQNKKPANRPLATVSDSTVCFNATITSGNTKIWNTQNDNFVGEAKYRNLTCGVKVIGQFAKVMKMDDESICSFAITNNGSYEKRSSYLPFVNEAKRRGLDCGVADTKTDVVKSKIKKHDFDLNKNLIHFHNFDKKKEVLIDTNSNVFYYHNSTTHHFETHFNYIDLLNNNDVGRYSINFSDKIKLRPIPWQKPVKLESVFSSTGKKYIKVLVKNFENLKSQIMINNYHQLHVHISYQNQTNPSKWAGWRVNTTHSDERFDEYTRLSLAFKNTEKVIASKPLIKPNSVKKAAENSEFELFKKDFNSNNNLSTLSAYKICRYSVCQRVINGKIKTTFCSKNDDYQSYLYALEAKRRGFDCGVNKNNETVIASKPKITKPSISSAELDAERKKRLELEKELAEIKNRQKQERQRINTDNQKPIINAFAKKDGSNAIITGRVTDNTEVVEVLLDGEQLSLTNNGTFETELYVPRNGLNVEIIAYDKKGNKSIKTLSLERGAVAQANGPTFDRLNPSGKRVKSNPNALALIIGVADYSKTPANALYADKDAQQFYDYATMKLGIPSSNIKELVNDKADLGEILINVKEWLRRSAKPDKSDIFIYFAGHGLASQDGSKMYLLPYDGRPRLLENTALLRDELFKDIKQANPRSVTVFLDTCYSGVTRNEEMLIAGRPIVIKAKEQAIPDGFTLFSAASNEQISRPLEEAKHGMFSYFLMKGMEGDADTNADNKITARELHTYVKQNVVQQSSGSQTPELQGDKDRVLVQFN